MPYRKRRDKDVWHWCSSCSNWPTSNYEETPTNPTTGKLCHECKSKQANGICR